MSALQSLRDSLSARRAKGNVSMDAIQWLAVLFIGLFIIVTVSDIVAINADSSLYTTYTDLITKTGTVYKVLVLVLIVILLAVAMRSLSSMNTGGGGSSQ